MHCCHDSSQKEFPKLYLQRTAFWKMLLKGFKKEKKKKIVTKLVKKIKARRKKKGGKKEGRKKNNVI